MFTAIDGSTDLQDVEEQLGITFEEMRTTIPLAAISSGSWGISLRRAKR